MPAESRSLSGLLCTTKTFNWHQNGQKVLQTLRTAFPGTACVLTVRLAVS